MKNITQLLTILLTLQTFAATQFTSDSKKGSLVFKAIGKPAFLKIEGKGDGPNGHILVEGKKLSGELSLNLNSLNTGIDLRDEHMKEKYLKTKETPTAILKIDDTELVSSYEETKKLEGKNFKAKLTLNKITKELGGEWKSQLAGNTNIVTANFSIKLSDFGIEIPEYAGITVADEVKIESTVALIPQTTSTLAR